MTPEDKMRSKGLSFREVEKNINADMAYWLEVDDAIAIMNEALAEKESTDYYKIAIKNREDRIKELELTNAGITKRIAFLDERVVELENENKFLRFNLAMAQGNIREAIMLTDLPNKEEVLKKCLSILNAPEPSHD